MKKFILKIGTIILCLTMIFGTLTFNPLVNKTYATGSLTNRYFYGVSDTALYPTSSMLSGWGWTGVSYTAVTGGGTNVSYSNFGNSDYCVGINKSVKFAGLDLLVNIDTIKGPAANDQYFYMNFCNGVQQNISTNPFAIRINRTIGQVVLYSNGNIIGVLDSRLEIMNTTNVRVQVVRGTGVYYVVVNGLIFTVSDSQIAACNNFSNPDATYVTISPVLSNTNCSIDILYLHGGESPDVDYIMASVPSEQYQVTNASDTIDLIDTIGTVTTGSLSTITTAQNMYDALGDYNNASYKTLVFNYQKLVDAHTAYDRLVTLTDKYFYGISSSLLYPAESNLSLLGWTGVSYTSLTGGGVNLSYSNYGDLYHCVGINKAVKFAGLDLKIRVDTVKAPNANDQYFYINFCNGNQQSFATNPFSIRINRTIGQIVLFSAGSPIGSLDNRSEIMSTADITVQVSAITGGYNVAVNGLNFTVTTAQIAACNNFSNPDSTYVTLSPVLNDTSFSIDMLSLHGGEVPCCDYILSSAPTEQYKLVGVDDIIDMIDAIGIVTVNSAASITAARSAYNAIGSYNGISYQPLVHNISTLISAEAANTVVQMIDSLGTITLDSRSAIVAAENAYLNLLPAERTLVDNYQTLVTARTTFDTNYGSTTVITFAGITPDGTATAGSIDLALDREAIFKATDTGNNDTDFTVVSGTSITVTEQQIDKSIYIKPTATGATVLSFVSVRTSSVVYTLTINVVSPVSSTYLDNSDVTPNYVTNDKVKLESADNADSLMSPDWVKSLIMVEMRIETATPEGTLKAAVSMLDHYKEAGINGIWITPVYAQCETGAHTRGGYLNYGPETINPDITGTENYQDGWEMFAWFVNQAHMRNIRVLLDTVTWGVDYDAPLITEHPEFFGDDSEWGGRRYLWNDTAWRSWYQDKMMNIINTTNIDGLRCDLEPLQTGYDLYGAIRQEALSDGHKIAIISEAQGSRGATYDFEQFGVGTFPVPHNNQLHTYYTDGTFNIVDSVKQGMGMGDLDVQTAGLGGQSRFYTFDVSDHDCGYTQVNKNLLTIGYQAVLAPFLPLWYMGEEMGSYVYDQPLYFEGKTPLTLLDNTENRTFYETLKKYIRIRRIYKDIFEYTPNNHRESNITKVSVAGGLSLQAYARFSGNKAILVVPNNNTTTGNFTATIPFTDLRLAQYTTFTVTNLLTDTVVATGSQSAIAQIGMQVPAGEIGVYLVEGLGKALTDKYFNGITSNGLYPTNALKTAWGNWGGVTYTDLAGGGVNLSYSSFGDPNYCVGINKTVKFNGLDFQFDVKAGKAVTANDQYFYLNFSNGLQQSFYTNPFAIRINRTIGQVILFSNGNPIGSLDNRYELKQNTRISVKVTAITGGYNVAVNGLNFTVTTAQIAACQNFSNPNATYVSISPVASGTNLSVDILSLHGGEAPCSDMIMAGVPAEQYQVFDAGDTIDLIDAIGTVTIDSGTAITAARNNYNALGAYNGVSYQGLVFNYSTLIAAETAYHNIVSPTSVTLDKTTMSIGKQVTSQLTATVLPVTAINKSVTWSSSNTAVATVSTTGLVTGVAVGTAVITVTTVDGGLTATCTVTVTRYDSTRYYKIAYYPNTNIVMDAVGTTSGTVVSHSTYNSNLLSQQWQITEVSSGTFKIINRNSGLALDVTGGTNSTGRNIIQSTYSSSNRMHWTITDNTSYVKLNSKLGTNTYIRGTGTSGATLYTASSSTSTTQRWVITLIP